MLSVPKSRLTKQNAGRRKKRPSKRRAYVERSGIVVVPGSVAKVYAMWLLPHHDVLLALWDTLHTAHFLMQLILSF